MLLIGGGLFLLFRFMRAVGASRPTPVRPATVEAPLLARGTARWRHRVQERAAAVDELDRGLGHVRQMDRGFDAAALASDAAETFRAVQRRWPPATAAAAPAALGRHARAPGGRGSGTPESGAPQPRRAHPDRADRGDGGLAGARPGLRHRVILAGSLIDYTVDAGRCGGGGLAYRPERFEDFWTFTRPVGPNVWTLTAIQTG